MKKPYITPELTIHGDVADLTAGVKLSGIADLGGQQHVGSHQPAAGS